MNASKGKVFFGTYLWYEQNEDCMPIEWLVLDVDEDAHKALLISRYALDCQKYNAEDNFITWEECTLRYWLNSGFMGKAFTREEQKTIVTAKVMADKNPDYNTRPGDDTQEKVFLLSIEEANRYFKDDETRMCVPTDYAIGQGANIDDDHAVDGSETCDWWLRSPSCDVVHAANVGRDGRILNSGNCIFCNGFAIRPAMWIDLNMIP